MDPNKSAEARIASLQSGALSYQRLYGELGLDWQVEQQQQADALGITLPEFRKLLVQKLYGSQASMQNTNQASTFNALARRVAKMLRGRKARSQCL